MLVKSKVERDEGERYEGAKSICGGGGCASLAGPSPPLPPRTRCDSRESWSWMWRHYDGVSSYFVKNWHIQVQEGKVLDFRPHRRG
jgi:hypothetical protein